MATIQDLGPCADKAILNALAQHLSDALLRILRQLISVNHPNRGVDLIERTHHQIIEAVLQPASADGKGLRAAFVPRVKFRLIDALNAQAAAARNRELYEAGTQSGLTMRRGSDGIAREVVRKGDASAFAEFIDVEQVLEQIQDSQKRLAFRLFMDGVPYKSKRSASIAEALGISEKTAREWVKEVQDQLSKVPQAQDLLQSNDRGSL